MTPRHNHPRDSQCLITDCPVAGYRQGKSEAVEAYATRLREGVRRLRPTGYGGKSVHSTLDAVLDLIEREKA